MEKEFLQRMFKIVREGGRLALDLMHNSEPTIKPDNSVLTKADMAVSSLIRSEIQDLLSTGGHILIDEEDAQGFQSFDQAFLEKTPYVWVIDPIDGTRSFANRIPFFGISIGILKNLRPWLGVVHFPAFNELFYADGTNAYFVTSPFSDEEKKIPIKPIDQDLGRQTVIYGNDGFFRTHDWDFDFCQMMMPSCAVIDLCWPAIGRGAGGFFDASIWDFAGSWPVFEKANLQLRSVSTGKVLDRIHTDLFQGKGLRTWRLKEQHILSSPRNYAVIKQGMKDKP